jgi:Domain of unknown function (DUF4214)
MLRLSRWFRRSNGSSKLNTSIELRRSRLQPYVEALEERCVPSTMYTVNSLLDTNTGTGNSGTLRYVMNLANTNHTGTAASPDQVQFTTGGGTIMVGADTLGASLPALANNEVAIIDGTTEAGYNGVPLVALDGTNATLGGVVSGLTISGGSSTIKGLSIVGFSGNGIQLDTNGNDTVLSCYVGVAGTSAFGNGHDGIVIDGTSGNIIGSSTAVGSPTGLGANVISDNGIAGIHILAAGATEATNNQILGNFIGTNVTGTGAVGNGGDGIDIVHASNNIIGGAAAGAGNVISGNAANGILISGSDSVGNQVVNNFIGTNATGSAGVGNGLNGIRLTDSTNQNTIGGITPTTLLITNAPPAPGKPADGNVISANGADGILIEDGASSNSLSGNFIGTDITGINALGNTADGVTIVNANNNSLLGTTVTQQPFVFLNLISANGGNGLRIDNSNSTTVQANFFGLADDNTTPLGNHLDGVLIEGSSAGTQFGGVIPLGNVSAGNGRNGVEIADTASGTVLWNTFAGLPAFKTFAVGNVLDGILVTSTGGNNLIRTNVVSGNGANGVHISGNATGVQVAEDIIGMTTNGAAALPNGANGVLIDGNAHNNLIGGTQVSVILENNISANGGNGVAVEGNAKNNQIIHSFIGTDITGVASFGNSGAGIFIGGNSQDTTIGGTDIFDQNLISGNLDGGIHLSAPLTAIEGQGTQIFNNLIGTDRTGKLPLGNHGNGVTAISRGNQIGGSASGQSNVIAFNTQAGVVVDTGDENTISSNSIFHNAVAGIGLISNGNSNQPAPVLSAAYQPTPTTIQITGNLTASPITAYNVEIFVSADTTPAGQGQTLLGTITVTTNASGNASFVFGATLPAGAGTSFTAAATNNSNHNTSAFSSAIGEAGNANSLYVASVYGLLLNRVPDSGSIFWVNSLDQGASPASVVLAIEGSAEYLQDQVVAIYSAYLNRQPDPSGEQFWVSFLMGGGTFEQMTAALAGSPEYFALQGSTNQGFVTGLYVDVLDRTPTTAEVDGWVTVLNSGTSRTTVATMFLTSTEYRTDLIMSDYETFLGRNADPAGLAAWLSAYQAGAKDQEVLAAIFGSPEGFAKWS